MNSQSHITYNQLQNYISTITAAFQNVNLKGKCQVDPSFFILISRDPYYRALCRLQSLKKSEEMSKMYVDETVTLEEDIYDSFEDDKESNSSFNFDITSEDCSNWKKNKEIYPFNYVQSFEYYNPFEDEKFMSQVKESINDLISINPKKKYTKMTMKRTPFINDNGKKLVRCVRKSGILTYREVEEGDNLEGEDKKKLLSEELRLDIQKKIKANTISAHANVDDIFS
uniref:SURP motif domain-containing protein n=1 Tax=Parastrongyloides trichosuri TaxID=131310 RepID=A0A0N4Z646_PARTI